MRNIKAESDPSLTFNIVADLECHKNSISILNEIFSWNHILKKYFFINHFILNDME